MPLFSFRCVSDGREPERYTLQVPFQFGPTHKLKEGGWKDHFDHLILEIVKNQGFHLLRVTGFRSIPEAEAFLPKIHGALLRLTVVKCLSLRTASTLQKPRLYDPPIDARDSPNYGGLMKDKGWTHLDGSVDPTHAVVIPEHLRIMEFGTGSISVNLSMPVEHLVAELLTGLKLPVENVARNNHLALAIDLYASSLWESIAAARVIILSTTLEALVRPQTVSPFIRAHLGAILEHLDNRRCRRAESEQESKEMDRLRSRVAQLRNESISRSLRELVVDQAEVLRENEEEAARNISLAYRVRSELLHEGNSDEKMIKEALAWLNIAVPRILEALIERACDTAT